MTYNPTASGEAKGSHVSNQATSLGRVVRCDGVTTSSSMATKWCPRCKKNVCTRTAETTLMGCNSLNYWCEFCKKWLGFVITKRWGKEESGFMPEIPIDELPKEDVMPFGKHKGVALDKVPDSYLDWLAGQDWVKDRWPVVWKYIMDNLKDIHKGVPDDDEFGEYEYKSGDDR